MSSSTLLFIVALSFTATVCVGQIKPGRCSPRLQRSVCTSTCRYDVHCPREEKCCPTSCGGTVCVKPVTQVKPMLVKPGECPQYAEGPWFCSSTCGMDGDCRGSLKCCRNLCGAYGCYRPNPEPMPLGAL